MPQGSMVKPFLSLMIVLFLSGGVLLTLIFRDWQTEGSIRQWESYRLRGYEFLARSQYDGAREFFSRSKISAVDLGKNNFRYALALSDAAKLYEREGDYEKSRQNLGHAISILERQTPYEHKSNFPLKEDLILLECQLASLDLKSGKGSLKAWQDCQRGLKVYLQQKTNSIDPIVSRTVCLTLAEIGDAASKEGTEEVLQQTCMNTSKIASLHPSMKGLVRSSQKKMQCPFTQSKVENIEDILSLAEKALKARNVKKARENIERAELLATDLDDPNSKTRLVYLRGKLNYQDARLEDAERDFLALLADKAMKDEKIQDDALTRLGLMYRQCGSDDDAFKVAQDQYALRQTMYGNESEKVTEIEIDLAKFLFARGQIKQGKQLCEHSRDAYLSTRKDGMGNLGIFSERLATALMYTGDRANARSLFEALIQQYEEGTKKDPLKLVVACYALAALDAMDGNNESSKRFFAQAQSMLPELDQRDTVQVANSTLPGVATHFNDKPIAAQFIKETIMTLPIPQDRRDAARASKTLKELEALKSSQSAAFSQVVENKVKQLKNAINKYPTPKLKGFPDV